MSSNPLGSGGPLASGAFAGRRNPLAQGTGRGTGAFAGRPRIIPGYRLRDPSGQLPPGFTDAMSAPQRVGTQVAGRDSIIPTLYGGYERMGGLLYYANIAQSGSYANKLIVLTIFCEGTVEEISAANVQIDDRAPVGGVLITTYDGSQSSVDSTMANSFAGWTETLAGFAYAVTVLPLGASEGFPRITALIKGKKCYDPRQNFLLNSNLLSSWGETGTCGVAQNALGPYGAVGYAWTLTDSNAGVLSSRYTSGTLASSAALAYTLAVKLAKTTGGTSKTVGFGASLTGTGSPSSTPVTVDMRFNTDTGAYQVTVGSSTVTVVDLGTFWRVYFTITNNATGNTAIALALYPATAVNGSFVDDATQTGSAVFTEAHARLSSAPTGYVATTGAVFNQPTAWSDNPAIINGDFLEASCGKTVDDESLSVAAEACDRMLGTGSPVLQEKSSQMTLALMDKRNVEEWVDILRGYMPGWVQDHGSSVKLLVDDATGSVAHVFDASNIAQDPEPVLFIRGIREIPDVVEVGYTDTTAEPYATRYASIGSGATKARIELPGLRSRSAALRFATARYNHYHLENIEGEITVFEYGVRVMPGDLATITEAAWGWVAQEVRILEVSDRGDGDWTLRFRVYDPDAYSGTVQSDPDYSWYPLVDPTSVPTVTGLTLALSPQQTGQIYQTRIRVRWAASVWPYLRAYFVTVESSGSPTDIVASALIQPRTGATEEWWVSPAVVPGETYTVRVRIVSVLEAMDAGATDAIFVTVAAASGGSTQAPVYVSETPPPVPINGTLWYKKDVGRMLMYYIEEGSPLNGQWLAIGA